MTNTLARGGHFTIFGFFLTLGQCNSAENNAQKIEHFGEAAWQMHPNRVSKYPILPHFLFYSKSLNLSPSCQVLRGPRTMHFKTPKLHSHFLGNFLISFNGDLLIKRRSGIGCSGREASRDLVQDPKPEKSRSASQDV